MKIVIMAAGRLREDAEQAHYRRYEELFKAAARTLRLPALSLTEVAESRASTAMLRKNEEAQAFLGRMPSGAMLVALDERGEAITSPELANLIQKARETAPPALVFAIGGPDGHGAPLLEAAARKIAFGRITLPHGLARIVLVEQLYRALTILQGHPYHRA